MQTSATERVQQMIGGYVTDEERRHAACIGCQDWHRYSVTDPELQDAPSSWTTVS
jgi:hypothetical protein